MSCSKSTRVLTISTPIGPLKIDGCSNGLHAINRIDSSDDNCLNIINVKEVKLDDHCPKIVQHTLNWFCKYFNCEIIESADLGPVVPICPKIKCCMLILLY